MSKEFDRLNIDGARLTSPQARRELIDRIQAAQEAERRFAVAARLGWHRQGSVLPPDRVIGVDGKKVWVRLDDRRPERWARYRTGGTLKGPMALAGLAAGSSRLELLLALALAGPVAAMPELAQPCILLVGPLEGGPDHRLAAAASVWGRHADPNMAAKLGFCVSSDATGNDLEDEAPAASPTLPAVDETRAAGGGERQAAKSLVGPVMRRDGGFGKGRLTADARRSPSVPVLLTSSRPLGELAALAGIKVDDAHHGRLVGVPLPDAGHGAFGDLHGAATDSADANSRDPCGISDASAPPRRRRTRVRAVGQGARSTRRPRSRRGAGDRPPALSDRADASLTRP